MNDIKKPQASFQALFSYVKMLYISSRIVFLLSSFLFFLAFVAISSGFYGEIFIPFFLALYVGLVVSFGIFGGCFILYFFQNKLPGVIIFPLACIPLAMSVFFLYPIL